MFFDCHTHTSDYVNSIKNISIENIGELTNLKNKYFSIGAHPWNANNVELDKIKSTILDSIYDKRLVAIGECGLDKIKSNNLKKQETVFKLQLILANQLNLPVIAHCVKCDEILFKYINEFPELNLVIHAYHGNIFQTKQFLKHNVFFSFGTDIFKNNDKLSTLIKNIPIEKVFFETDDMNINIGDVYKRFSEIANISFAELTNSITQNAIKVFNINKL